MNKTFYLLLWASALLGLVGCRNIAPIQVPTTAGKVLTISSQSGQSVTFGEYVATSAVDEGHGVVRKLSSGTSTSLCELPNGQACLGIFSEGASLYLLIETSNTLNIVKRTGASEIWRSSLHASSLKTVKLSVTAQTSERMYFLPVPADDSSLQLFWNDDACEPSSGALRFRKQDGTVSSGGESVAAGKGISLSILPELVRLTTDKKTNDFAITTDGARVAVDRRERFFILLPGQRTKVFEIQGPMMIERDHTWRELKFLPRAIGGDFHSFDGSFSKLWHLRPPR